MVVGIHLLGFGLCFLGSLAKTLLLSRWKVTPSRASLIVVLNKITGLAAGISLLSGLAMVFGFDTPAIYYFEQGLFLGKLALFGAISALVVVVKPFFRAAAQSESSTSLPFKVRMFLLADLLGLPLIAAAGYWIATH